MNTQLICSAPNKERLTALINEFYFSENYFINENNEAENKKTGKKLGVVKQKKNRFQYFR